MSLSPVLLPLYGRAALATTNIGHYPAQMRGLFDIGHRDLFANELLQSPGLLQLQPDCRRQHKQPLSRGVFGRICRDYPHLLERV